MHDRCQCNIVKQLSSNFKKAGKNENKMKREAIKVNKLRGMLRIREKKKKYTVWNGVVMVRSRRQTVSESFFFFHLFLLVGG